MGDHSAPLTPLHRSGMDPRVKPEDDEVGRRVPSLGRAKWKRHRLLSEDHKGWGDTAPALRHPRAEQAEGRRGDPGIHA